jgi:hypothetical protein
VVHVITSGLASLTFITRALVGIVGEQWGILQKELAGVRLGSESDKVVWKLTASDIFSVKSFGAAMQHCRFLWKVKILMRIKIFISLMLKKSILDVLKHRGRCFFDGTFLTQLFNCNYNSPTIVIQQEFQRCVFHRRLFPNSDLHLLLHYIQDSPTVIFRVLFSEASPQCRYAMALKHTSKKKLLTTSTKRLAPQGVYFSFKLCRIKCRYTMAQKTQSKEFQGSTTITLI